MAPTFRLPPGGRISVRGDDTVSLLSLTSLSAAQVVGTDLAFGLGIALVGTGVHLFGGAYDGLLLTKLAIGGVLGGIAGSGVAPQIPNRYLRFALSLWLLIIGFQFCYQAARDGHNPAHSATAIVATRRP